MPSESGFESDSLLPDPDAVESFRQDTYEASTVEYILRKMKRLDLRQEIRDHHKSEEGSPRLGLAGLNVCTEFPMTLVTKKMRHITAQTLVTLLTRPTMIEPMQAYLLLVEEHADAFEAENLGLVFAWPGWTKFAVMHNSQRWAQSRGMRITWLRGKKRIPTYIETLDSLLQAMDITEIESD